MTKTLQPEWVDHPASIYKKPMLKFEEQCSPYANIFYDWLIRASSAKQKPSCFPFPLPNSQTLPQDLTGTYTGPDASTPATIMLSPTLALFVLPTFSCLILERGSDQEDFVVHPWAFKLQDKNGSKDPEQSGYSLKLSAGRKKKSVELSVNRHPTFYTGSLTGPDSITDREVHAHTSRFLSALREEAELCLHQAGRYTRMLKEQSVWPPVLCNYATYSDGAAYERAQEHVANMVCYASNPVRIQKDQSEARAILHPPTLKQRKATEKYIFGALDPKQSQYGEETINNFARYLTAYELRLDDFYEIETPDSHMSDELPKAPYSALWANPTPHEYIEMFTGVRMLLEAQELASR